MKRVPVMDRGQEAGVLVLEREGLYTRFTVECALPERGVFCAWAIGTEGALRIGVLEPVGGKGSISRRFSETVTAPLGALERGELRPVEERTVEADWQLLQRPEAWFRSPWLCGLLRGLSGTLAVREGTLCRIAIPYDGKQPFPLAELFCFARTAQAAGKRCVLYAFDGKERPVFL